MDPCNRNFSMFGRSNLFGIYHFFPLRCISNQTSTLLLYPWLTNARAPLATTAAFSIRRAQYTRWELCIVRSSCKFWLLFQLITAYTTRAFSLQDKNNRLYQWMTSMCSTKQPWTRLLQVQICCKTITFCIVYSLMGWLQYPRWLQECDALFNHVEDMVWMKNIFEWWRYCQLPKRMIMDDGWQHCWRQENDRRGAFQSIVRRIHVCIEGKLAWRKRIVHKNLHILTCLVVGLHSFVTSA